MSVRPFPLSHVRGGSSGPTGSGAVDVSQDASGIAGSAPDGVLPYLPDNGPGLGHGDPYASGKGTLGPAADVRPGRTPTP